MRDRDKVLPGGDRIKNQSQSEKGDALFLPEFPQKLPHVEAWDD